MRGSGGVGGRVRCMGADRDDVRLGVVGEDHGAEVVHGVCCGSKRVGKRR